MIPLETVNKIILLAKDALPERLTLDILCVEGVLKSYLVQLEKGKLKSITTEVVAEASAQFFNEHSEQKVRKMLDNYVSQILMYRVRQNNIVDAPKGSNLEFEVSTCSGATSTETTKDYAFHTSNKIWLAKARLRVSESNPPLTLLLDLDETVIFYGSAHRRFNKAFKLLSEEHRGGTVYFDPKAMENLLAFQSNGHEIMIITQGGYLYSDIKMLFATQGIFIEDDAYYNKVDIGSKHGDKKYYIDRHEFNHETLLIDDKMHNEPTYTHFLLSGPTIPFPSLT
ncbi:hypothetical protein D5R81_08620 [Parashewanella spongiae]|uniref:Uncharacterized protein n=1 Tax=Parashewanella spongiae TaxID=342950 RepID=A0A3A6TYR3_9GAMM|nr:hypothetical protein [Parashewanella spongiae]MCL1078079.1 hypothetical protein [Parashewanella spongiae]RJY16952.1 hypothetical protein D5R81_08620 [Parashewanella spongiae]